MALLVELYKFECAVASEHGASEDGEVVNHNVWSIPLTHTCSTHGHQATDTCGANLVRNSVADWVPALSKPTFCSDDV